MAVPARAGRVVRTLRHRVTIEGATTTQGSYGEPLQTWGTIVADEPADVRPASGNEFIQAAAVQARIDTRITIRYREGIDSTMRVQMQSRQFQIRAALPDPTYRRHLTLMCEEIVGG